MRWPVYAVPAASRACPPLDLKRLEFRGGPFEFEVMPPNQPNRPERPPKGLETAGRRLWNSMVLIYDFNTAERQTLLELCRTADTLEHLALLLQRSGKPLLQPALLEQRQQRIVYARLLASLRLPDVEDGLKRAQHRTGVRTPYEISRLKLVK